MVWVRRRLPYVKHSFQPLRTFRSLADANVQLAEWVIGEAGNRCHGTTGDRLRHGAYRLVLDGKSYRAPRPLNNEKKTEVAKAAKTAK